MNKIKIETETELCRQEYLKWKEREIKKRIANGFIIENSNDYFKNRYLGKWDKRWNKDERRKK